MSKERKPKYTTYTATYLKPLNTHGTYWEIFLKHENGNIIVLGGDARMIERILKTVKPNQKVIVNYKEEWDWNIEFIS